MAGKHGADRYVTSDEHKTMVLLAYHDAICPEREKCTEREQHTGQLVGNFPTLERFLNRLSELELEDAVSAV
jgi:hypothetical protein